MNPAWRRRREAFGLETGRGAGALPTDNRPPTRAAAVEPLLVMSAWAIAIGRRPAVPDL